MSHRWDCPSEYEARTRGERDYESYGYRRYSTPYDGECEEAARAYSRGMASAEYRAEEEAAERRAIQRRQAEEEAMYQAAIEQQYWEQQQAEYDAAIARQYELDMAAAYAELEAEGELNPPEPETNQ